MTRAIGTLRPEGDGRPLIEDVSLEMAPADVVGLVGPNGAGKSTPLRTFYQALRPTSGRVLQDATGTSN